jgi:hypothetical protein
MNRKIIHIEAIGLRCEQCGEKMGGIFFRSRDNDEDDSHLRKEDTVRILIDNDARPWCESCISKAAVGGTLHDQEISYDKYNRVRGIEK